jgi:hypothetical protein
MTMLSDTLPVTIGTEIVLSTSDPQIWTWLEWHGFDMFESKGSEHKFRRCRPLKSKFFDSLFMPVAEPHCPPNAAKFIKV